MVCSRKRGINGEQGAAISDSVKMSGNCFSKKMPCTNSQSPKSHLQAAYFLQTKVQKPKDIRLNKDMKFTRM